jgi:hypothetical protein
METFTMSKKEVDQIAIFEALKGKTMKQARAAELLELSIRQVKRKLKVYRAKGAVSLVHAARDKPSNRQFKDDRCKIKTRECVQSQSFRQASR